MRSACKGFAKKHDIFDIVLYGSVMRGKQEARDVDLMLVFERKALKERAETAQELKDILNQEIERLDVKTINLHELFDSDFLARQALFVEGYSVVHDAPFSERLGFGGHAIFTYGLKNLDHNEKTRFTYALGGRKGKGIREQLNIKSLGRGAVIVPVGNSIAFEEFLQSWNVSYVKRMVLVSLL